MNKIFVKDLSMVISVLGDVINLYVFGNALNQLSTALVLRLLSVAIRVGTRVLALL